MNSFLIVKIIYERMHRTPGRPGLERVSITSGMLTKQRHTGPFRASPLLMLHLAILLSKYTNLFHACLEDRS